MKELLEPITNSDALTGAEEGDSDLGSGSGSGSTGHWVNLRPRRWAGAERARRIRNCGSNREGTFPVWWQPR